MTVMSMVEAIRQTIEDEMAADERIMMLGEDVGLNAAVAALSGAPTIGDSGPQHAKPGN